MRHTSPGNSVEINQSDDDFGTPEVFPILCAICIKRSATLRKMTQWSCNCNKKTSIVSTNKTMYGDLL